MRAQGLAGITRRERRRGPARLPGPMMPVRDLICRGLHSPGTGAVVCRGHCLSVHLQPVTSSGM